MKMNKIYYLLDPCDIDEETLHLFYALMPPERKKQYEKGVRRYRVEGILCYALLLYAKALAGDDPHSVRLSYSPGGKPYTDGFYFNFSHCPECVLCAVSEKEIGADVQKEDRTSRAVIEKYCTDAEKKLLADGVPFRRLWTLKEAFVKYTGEGIGGLLSLPDLSPCMTGEDEKEINGKILQSTELHGCSVSVCSEKAGNEFIRVDIKELRKLLTKELPVGIIGTDEKGGKQV